MDMPEEVLKIGDLVSMASLDVSVLAGEAGLDREVLWAHSCELADPWQWLGPHELLMTVGLCVPAVPDLQVEFLGRLVQAGLAGLMIGDHDTAPPLSPEMLRAADRYEFPVLLAGAQTPYAVVARHVAAANTSSQIFQVIKLSKLYHVAANADDDTDGLVRDLVSLLGTGIRVEDGATGLAVIAREHPSKAEAQWSRRYPLRGAHAADLLLAEYPGEELEGFVLVHLMKVLEVAIDRILAAADHRTDMMSRAMAGLLDRADPAAVDEILDPHLASGGYQIAAFDAAEGPRVARTIALRELPAVVGTGRNGYLALVPTPVVAEFRALTEPGAVRFGVSSIFSDYRDVRIAADEAVSVLAASQHGSQTWTEYEGTTVSVLARSHREAVAIITGVLGPLASESAGPSKLRDTLFAYLRNDRRWAPTAQELGIHRQTLSYRLNRIQEETGLDLARSSDLSALWIAYQAWQTTHGTAQQPPANPL